MTSPLGMWAKVLGQSIQDGGKVKLKLNIRCTHEVGGRSRAWFYLNACWTDGSICMDKHWSKLAQNAWKKRFLTSWPWPLTYDLDFLGHPEIIQVDPWPKFGDPRSSISVLNSCKQYVLGYWNKETNKETKNQRNKETKKQRNKETKKQTRWKLK